MEIEFQGQYTKPQLYKAIRLANTPSRRGAVIRWLLMAILLILVGISIVGLLKQEINTARAIRFFISSSILAYFLVRPYILSWRAVSHLWKQGTIRAPVSGRVTGSGIVYTSSAAERTYRWEDFARVRKTKDLIVLITADGTVSIHPREFFKSDMDWEKFQQLIAFNVVEAR